MEEEGGGPLQCICVNKCLNSKSTMTRGGGGGGEAIPDSLTSSGRDEKQERRNRYFFLLDIFCREYFFVRLSGAYGGGTCSLSRSERFMMKYSSSSPLDEPGTQRSPFTTSPSLADATCLCICC